MHTPRQAASDLSFFSKSKAPKAGSSKTAVTVTTRVVSVKKSATPSGTPGPSGSVQVVAREATPSSSVSVPHKRKLDVPAAPSQVKRPRTSASPSIELPGSARGHVPTREPSPRELPSRESSPEVSLRGITSRSASVDVRDPATRRWWTEEDGRLGPDFMSYESVVRDNIKHYTSYFKNPDDPEDKSFEAHPTDYPVVDLEFPNSGACERFALLVPKDPDLYTPLQGLESSLLAILEFYLSPEQRSLFGTMPNARFQDTTDDDPPVNAPSPPLHPEALHSTVSTPSSDSSTSSLSSASSISSALSLSSVSSATSVSSISSLSSLSSISDLQYLASQTYNGPPCVDYLKLFQRALYRHDGPLFLKVMDAINALLRAFKYPTLPPDAFQPSMGNVMRETIRHWSSDIPDKIVTQVLGEAYDRAVKPYSDLLNKNYTPFSSQVYGELLPPFICDVIKTTRLTENSLFMDLGSGVGNVVLQTSLATGCKSYGIEIMPAPAKIAREQLEQFQIRCRMWGLRMGPVELEEGDMLESRRVVELLQQADVVLVNNKVFSEELNDALRAKFLDLKEGAIVVSLQTFKRGGSNSNDIGRIFDAKEKRYRADSVSWTGQGGTYWVHHVNRQRAFAADSSSKRPSRNTRSSRR